MRNSIFLILFAFSFFMKKLILLLLVLGLVFADGFPTSIPGTDLVLHDSGGNLYDGVAAYKNYGDTESSMDTEPMGAGEWETKESWYNTGGEVWGVTTIEGITYYYQCGEDFEEILEGEYQEYVYCWVETYYDTAFYISDGTFFNVDTYIDDGEEADALDISIKVAQAVIDACPKEDGNGGDDGNNGNGGNGYDGGDGNDDGNGDDYGNNGNGENGNGDSNGDDDSEEVCPCTLGLVLIGLTSIGLFRR